MSHDQSRAARMRAERLLGAGHWEDAAAAYRALVSAHPAQADAWFNLAYACRRAGQFTDALAAYAMALRHGVEAPEVAHLNRAAILSDHLRRDADAIAELQAAIGLAPDFAPALLNLGNLHEELGQRTEAIDCYHRLQASGQSPSFAGEALARLLRLEPPASHDAPLLAQVDNAIADPAIDDSTRANLLFSLGQARDRLGDSSGAFAAFSDGKRYAHLGRRPYDPARDRQRTLALIASARPADHEAARSAATAEPLFICGMFRSGSTLLEQVLAAHPQVAAAGELDLLPRMAAGPLAPFPASLLRLDVARSHAMADAYLDQVRLRLAPLVGTHPRYFTDKRPDNYLLIGLIKRLFPTAKILHTVRHPLDNALSVFMQHLNPAIFDYAGSLASIGNHYGEYRRLMAHWKALYPGDVFDFDYDAFIASPAATLRALLDFVDLPWEPVCLEFHRLRNAVKTASYWQVRQPLYRDASGRWRRYRDHLGPLLDALRAQNVPVSDV